MSHDSYERLSSADYYPNSKCAGVMGSAGTLDEMMSRYHKCMCEHGVDMYCPYDEYERRAPTRLYGHAEFPRWRPTTTSTTTTTTPRPRHDNAGFPRWWPTTSSPRRTWYDEDSYSNNRGAWDEDSYSSNRRAWDEDSYFSNRGGWSTDNVQPNMSFQPVFVGWNIIGWLFLGGLVAAAAVLLSWKCSKRRQQAGESGCQRPDSGTERSREVSAPETAPLRPSASPAPPAPPAASHAPSAPPAATPADDLPPPYELVAHLAPPPYHAAMGPDGGAPGFDATKGDDATKGEAATKDGDAATRSDHAFSAADVCVMMDEEHGDTAAKD